MISASTAATGTHLPSLTGLRAVAALGVFCFHAVVLGCADRSPPGLLVAVGPPSVSFFFVLSGYLLARSAHRAGPEPRPVFWRRRLIRLYPVHLVLSLAVVTGLVLTAPATARATVVSALPSAFLVQAWLPDFRYVLGGNGSSWPLACEVFFYALFPALWAAVRRIPRSLLLPAAGCAVAATWAVAAFAHTVVPGGAPLPQAPFTMSRAQLWTVYSFPPARLPEFVLGMLLTRLPRTGHAPRTGVGTAAAVLGAAVVAGWCLLPQVFSLAAVTVVPLALLLRAAAAADLTGGPSYLRSPPLLFLGRISHPLCQGNSLVIASLYLAVGTALPVLTAAVALPLTVAFAWLLHRYVEQPCAGRLATARRGRDPRRPVSG
ncbi:acyltransferase family protein [Streptomyces beigongshangae]|uniref:acyltransferase family protein n=1 Tax=Streptomyces beigongshangae TaxID=2841597 RepID=UPI001C862DD9|nr:acyltransferase [Streptomyces sp. REN17]